MKVLCFYADHFSYTIGDKNHEAVDARPSRAALLLHRSLYPCRGRR